MIGTALRARLALAVVPLLLLTGCADADADIEPDAASDTSSSTATSSSAGAMTAAAAAPAPRVSQADLRAALRCRGDLARGATPILLLHGTSSSAAASWSWNWRRTLQQRGQAVCTLDSPGYANTDLQVGGEYVVAAVRRMHARAGRPISVVGHSHGGMILRWALRFWPETRSMVDDYVGLGGSNHGTTDFDARCASTCPEAWWQQRPDSSFLRSLNRGSETVPEVSFTMVATRMDQSLLPYDSTFLRNGGREAADIAVQSLCPGRRVDHLGLLYDNATWAIALDALNHRGPARLGRVPRAACRRALMPGVVRSDVARRLRTMGTVNRQSRDRTPQVDAEPPLRWYARWPWGQP